MISFLLLLSTATAGKLSDGWHGLPYGPASVLETAPTSVCTRTPEATVAWICDETIGGAPVKVHYMADEGWFTGVMIKAESYASCSVLFDVLTAAWKVPFTPKSEYDKGLLPDGFWNLMAYKRETAAAWHYNTYSDTCSASTMNTGLSALIEAAKAKRAAAAAESL
jgi:hypothetical protein